jgi:hypothetical protein
MSRGDVPAPKPKVTVYYTIRVVYNDIEDARVRGRSSTQWVTQGYTGRYDCYSREAKRFKELAEAKRVATYLAKKTLNGVGSWDWNYDAKFEVVKVVVEKKVELEWPLTLLEKLAKEAV